MFEDVMLAYGGIDAVVVTAGIFVPPDKSGRVEDRQWALTFGINVTGAYIVADEAYKIFKQAGPDAATSCSRRAPTQSSRRRAASLTTRARRRRIICVRELAIEMSPLVRVNAVAPATVVKGSTMFPRDRVIASLTKYEIAFNEDEDTEDLRDKLATLLRQTLAHADAHRA